MPSLSSEGATGAVDADLSEEDGLQEEGEDPQEIIKDPFNPEKINIRTHNVLVDHLVSRIEYGEIDLAPDFQRQAGIWTAKNQSRLIESLLLRIPIPVFYVASDENDVWAVVDGIQRMTTIYNYRTGKFPLTRLEYLTFLDGFSYDDLGRQFQRRINETSLIVNIIEPGTPPEVMFNVFLRINTGGLTLNAQEIRHATNPGPVRDYLKELAKSREFLKATCESIKSTRMADRECVLRFLAFYIDQWEQYTKSDLDGYLGHAMQKINKMGFSKRKEYAEDFKKAMQVASDIFEENAFRNVTGGRRRPISRALFETWSVQLARCNPKQIESLVAQRDTIQACFRQLLMEDSEFEGSISYSTGVVKRVHKRFGAIQQLVEGFV